MLNHFVKIILIAGFVLLAVAFIGFPVEFFSDSKRHIAFKTSEQWFSEGKKAAQQRKLTLQENAKIKRGQKAKNIILVVGDGMGISTLTAARIFTGQQQGLSGEEFSLSFEKFPYSALIKTYNVDLQIPDSAGTMSALMTGVKTNEGIISLPDTVERGECSSIGRDKQQITTLMDIAKSKGKSTAVVTTARVTHATPAATYAHSVDRSWESDDKLTEQARTLGCEDIATQFVEAKQSSVDLLFGGGRRHFLPKGVGGKRKDQKNLIEQWQASGGTYLQSAKELQGKSLDSQKGPVLGLFALSHMAYEYQRPDSEPSLKQMTKAALGYLSTSNEGYFLVIESGRIDHGHHDGSAYRALTETQQLHETVAWLMTQVDTEETLVVVTADHSHGMVMAGYATRGNPILGKIKGNAYDGIPITDFTQDSQGNTYTSLAYRDGPGALQERDTKLRTDHPDYRQIALVPMDYESHGGEDVALFAIGPNAQLFSGTLEQNWIFHGLKYAM